MANGLENGYDCLTWKKYGDIITKNGIAWLYIYREGNKSNYAQHE